MVKHPDPGRIHYRIHNVYLNFVETYGRIDAGTPITIHQKALFTFWISVIILWIFIQLTKLLNYIKNYKQQKYSGIIDDDIPIPDDDISPRLNGVNYLNERTFTAKLNNLTNPPKNDPMFERVNVDDTTDDTETKLTIWQRIYVKFEDICFARDKEQPKFEEFLLKMILFGGIMFYFWLCDHLRIWPKVEKQYSRDIFVFLFFLLVFVAFLFTIRKTTDKLLVRDQTEEWKGWMQVQFVWYHYWDAQEVYNSIRVYVGAYVWMTGFGNYIYFSTRKDYSIFRLLKMLFRLNFLVFCVMAVTDHEFVRYYICAMHTYWFLTVWATMVVMNRYNKYPAFIIGKFLIYIIINAMIFNIPGAHEKVFTPFKWALHDANGTLQYWKLRSWLDHWSTIVGMIVAFNYERYEKFLIYLDKDEPSTRKMRESIRYGITTLLVIILCIWVHYILSLNKHHYLSLHPFVSPIPIVIYTWLRNMHPILRSYHLNLFTWLGKITLETYLSQIHIYMMHSAQRILVYLPNYPLLNFTLATLIYIFVSYVLFKLTVFFSGFILPRNGDVVIKNIFLGFMWLSVCYVFAYTLTYEHVWPRKHSGLEFLRWNITKT